MIRLKTLTMRTNKFQTLQLHSFFALLKDVTHWGYLRVLLKLYWGSIGVVLGLYWGSIRVILGLYWDNSSKRNENYCLGSFSGGESPHGSPTYNVNKARGEKSMAM